ncbi:Ig-like domain-containing protein [Elusimicrobiota bacterium]
MRKGSLLWLFCVACFVVPGAFAEDYTASEDFSTTQGHRGWYYMDSNGSQMTYDAEKSRWQGDETYLLEMKGAAHPGKNADAVLRWVAPENGGMRIRGNAHDRHTGCGTDGVRVRIARGSQTLWEAAIAKDDAVGSDFDVSTRVVSGAAIDFIVNKGTSDTCDSTAFDPTIALTPESPPFTIAVLPDTQVYSQRLPEIFTSQTEWIARNAAQENIAFVLHEGDITNVDTEEEWVRAQASLAVLDGQVPYALAVGNHDFVGTACPGVGDTDLFNQYFPVSRYEGLPTFGGVYEAGKLDTSYHTFRAGGRDYLVLALEYMARDQVLSWADGVIAAHPGHKVIVVTHLYLNDEDRPAAHGELYVPGSTCGNDGQALWEKFLKKHEDMLLVLNGHFLGDGLGRLISRGEQGNDVFQLLANYQMYAQGGEGYLRLMKFVPDEEKIYVKTYSPYVDEYKTDPFNQFVIDLAQGRFLPDDNGPPDTVPPSVGITSPLSGATISGTASATVDASDDRAIAKVDLLIDGKVVAHDSLAPFSFTRIYTTSLVNGTHTLTARVFDTRGNSSEDSVSVTVLNGHKPNGYHSYSSCTRTVGYACDADDYSQPLKVHFYDGPAGGGNTPIGSITADVHGSTGIGAVCGGYQDHVFHFDMPGALKDGKEHAIHAYAINIGLEGSNPLLWKSPRSVTCADEIPPTVRIAQPGEGAQVSGITRVAVDASDANGIAKVELYVDGAVKGTDVSAPYEFEWDADGVPDGAHTLLVRAYDLAGLTAEHSVGVTVARKARRFSIVVLPDSQNYTLFYPEVFTAQTQWIAENAAPMNIEFVLHEGDITNWNSEIEWQRARESMSHLDGVVPYALVVGNHDMWDPEDAGTMCSPLGDTTLFNEYFPVSRYAGLPSFGGTREAGKLDNSYHFFSAGGKEYMVISLEFGPGDESLAWASQLVAEHPSHEVIIVTHMYLNDNDTRPGGVRAECGNDGEDMWDELVRKHENISFVLNGHVIGGDALGKLISVGDHGNTVYQILANYQMESAGGNGYLRVMEFAPDENKVYVRTYSPYRDLYKENPENFFSIDLAKGEFVPDPSTEGKEFYWAAEDFSDIQGHRGWRYMDSTGAEMTYDTEKVRWQGAEPYALLRRGGGHPGDSVDPVLRWTAPQGGTARATGSFGDRPQECGTDGVIARVKHDSVLLWEATIANDDPQGQSFDETVRMAAGDTIDFTISKGVDNKCDGVDFEPAVAFAPAQPPSVTISTPVAGSTVSATVAIAAEASGPAEIAKVEFYVDGALKGTDTTSPYAYSWNSLSVADGTHTLRAKAYDALRNTAEHSIIVSVRNGTLPKGYHASSDCTQTVGYTCDPDDYSQPLKVHFYDGPVGGGNVPIGSITADVHGSTGTGAACGGYQDHIFHFDTPDSLKDGAEHAIHAYAIDIGPKLRNPLIWRSPRSVTCADEVPPTVRFAQPADGDTILGTMSVKADAGDAMGVTKVEFFLDGGAQPADTEAPFTFSLDIDKIASGPHTITAKAYDPAGNMGVHEISVSVEKPEAEAPPPAPGFELTGEPETVFDWTTDRCDDVDIPDGTAHAFRDIDGKVNLIATHYDNYRMIGDSLDTVKRDCAKIMSSREDPDQFDNAYREWLIAPYTLDGQTVYAIVHNEWYAFLTDPKCSSANRADGWVNSLTLGVSRDKGKTYSHPEDYLIVNSSIPWSESYSCSKGDFTRYGIFAPSNIVKHGEHYYSLLQSERDPEGLNEWGVCVMRTRRLDEAAAWEMWTPYGWDDSPTAMCAPVSRSKLFKVHGSLSYNTHLGAFLTVGQIYGYQGVFMSVSRDLFHWSDPVKIMSNENKGYFSFLDPDDPTRNFERTGREVYLYYTQFNGGLDRDLMRRRIRFDLPDMEAPNVAISTPVAGSTASGMASVEVQADDDVGIARVELYVDGKLKVADSSAPYTFPLDTLRLSNGQHTLSVKAFDAAQKSAEHSVIVEVENILPSGSSLYRASDDFSPTQGHRGWYYMDSKGSLMTYDAEKSRWQGDETYLLLKEGGGHPGVNADAVLRWESPENGSLRITGSFRDGHAGCGTDGVVARVKRGPELLWEATIARDDGVGRDFDLRARVVSGDAIDFIVNKGFDSGCDSTEFDPTISLTPNPPAPVETFFCSVDDEIGNTYKGVFMRPRYWRTDAAGPVPGYQEVDDRFFCSETRKETLLRCANPADSSVGYWDTMSVQAHAGQTIGDYYCKVDGDVWKWAENDTDQLLWKDKFYFGHNAYSMATKLDWVFTHVDSKITKLTFSLKNAPGNSSDICLITWHPQGRPWDLTGETERICLKGDYPASAGEFKLELPSDMFLPAGTWVSCMAAIYTGEQPQDQLFECRADLIRGPAATGAAKVTRAVRFPPIDQFARPIPETDRTTMPRVPYESLRDFPITVDSFYVFTSFNQTKEMDACILWLDKDKKEKSRFCMDHFVKPDGWSSLMDVVSLPEKWVIPPGEYLDAGCTFYGGEYSPLPGMPEIGGIYSDCAVFANVEIPEGLRNAQGAFRMLAPDDLDTYCRENKLYYPHDVSVDEFCRLLKKNFAEAPIVTITEPLEGSAVSGTISIFVDATDNDGIAKVEFYVDGALKAADLEAPYTHAWDSLKVADGAHQIMARAYDESGHRAEHAITINVSNAGLNDALFVSQVVPAVMTGGEEYAVSVTMQNTGRTTWTESGKYRLGSQNPRDNKTWGTHRVFLSEAEAVAPGGSKTFAFEVTAPTSAGTYDFQWRMVRDHVEWFGEMSENVSVRVDPVAPRVNITKPADGAMVAGMVGVEAVVAEGADIARVEFYVDGRLKATDTSAPYGFDWDADGVPDGSHTLTAKAYDAAGDLRENLIAVTVLREKRRFSIAILPDTQIYVKHRPEGYPDFQEIFTAQTRWIAENAESNNIEFVLHEGDITESNIRSEWEAARSSMEPLDGVVPYALAVGNHDLWYSTDSATMCRPDGDTSLFNEYFPLDSHKDLSGFGGVFDGEPRKFDNSYHYFSAGGKEYLVLSLTFYPSDAMLDWANRVVAEHPDHEVIVLTHMYLNYEDRGDGEYPMPDRCGNNGEDMWNEFVRKHENISFVFNGHMPGVNRLVSTGDHGNKVYQMLADYQAEGAGGNGYLRLLEFAPDEDKVYVTSYSPFKDKYKKDPENYFSIDLRKGEFVPGPAAQGKEYYSASGDFSASAFTLMVPRMVSPLPSCAKRTVGGTSSAQAKLLGEPQMSGLCRLGPISMA